MQEFPQLQANLH
ncbi:hypothetical protein Pint_30536 [Pistacia integerrima]|uniref:Uncharacterized protein n=1 Tax=Pistacia integerrima TaxID=434235 RepID=A0ACC0X0Z9_9ROSI|nr:hypothetical protein Pint_30536 [Pistacia integerrima]